jgi:hypothetical protein
VVMKVVELFTRSERESRNGKSATELLLKLVYPGTFHFTTIIESQQYVWFLIPPLPLFIVFFISVDHANSV